MSDPLVELRGRYVARLREQGAELARLTAAGELASPDLRRLVHGLAGSAGTFGFPAISAAALVIDDAMTSGAPADRRDLEALAREIDAAVKG